ncbi:hypothetical protein MtrunA17_Chr6g0480101 [Medicago truncatula]|uniref:Uncharacterized protein n=1 Tax=Medicago truncatula TaxID=3880 RepID=A0A396HIQ2_MEDTR|nr:hypothetical protein MtrunA17_Chr6g0480101 [Medicago truncatula]
MRRNLQEVNQISNINIKFLYRLRIRAENVSSIDEIVFVLTHTITIRKTFDF